MPVALLCLVALAPPAAAPLAAAPAVADPTADPTADPATTDPATAPLPEPKVLRDGVRAWGDLPFRKAGDDVLKMDLVTPAPPVGEDDDPSARPPLLIFVHGGGWVAGSKLRYKAEALDAARHGRAAAAVEYRLSRVGRGGTYVAPFPAALNDVRAAVAFLVARADELRVNPNRVVLIGDSAGGHLSLLTALSANGDPSGERTDGDDESNDMSNDAESRVPRTPVAAVVNLFGVTDMPAYYTGSQHARTVLSLFLAGHLRDRRLAYDAASPVRFVDADDPPVLTLHGTGDRVVPFDQAKRLHAALEKAGVSNELVPIAGGMHGLFRQRDTVHDTIARFLEARLAAEDSEANAAAVAP